MKIGSELSELQFSADVCIFQYTLYCLLADLDRSIMATTQTHVQTIYLYSTE